MVKNWVVSLKRVRVSRFQIWYLYETDGAAVTSVTMTARYGPYGKTLAKVEVLVKVWLPNGTREVVFVLM